MKTMRVRKPHRDDYPTHEEYVAANEAFSRRLGQPDFLDFDSVEEYRAAFAEWRKKNPPRSVADVDVEMAD